MTEQRTSEQVVYGTYYAIVGKHGHLIGDNAGNPLIFATVGPYAEETAAKHGRRVVRVLVVEAINYGTEREPIYTSPPPNPEPQELGTVPEGAEWLP